MAGLPILRRHHQPQSQSVARRSENEPVPLRQMMNRLFDESFLMPALFEEVFAGHGSAGTNLYETADGYVVQLAMPGVKPESIDCTVVNDVLTCTGQAALQAPDQGTAIWESLGGQSAYRIQLPGEVEAGNAQATYENGILTITVPKAAHARAQTIKVTTK